MDECKPLDAGLVSPGRNVLSHRYKGTTFYADLRPGWAWKILLAMSKHPRMRRNFNN